LALQAELIDGVIRCPGHSERRKRQIMLRMQRARLCLEGQAGDGLRIAELARRTNFSPWYFSKVFHAIYGIGPLQFAARMRLEHASRLLATTLLSVTDVSAACGFDNPCSFARAFRARFGMTASEHRLRNARGCVAQTDSGRRSVFGQSLMRTTRGVQ
jgi:AraC family transcriptional regulator